MTDTQTTPMPPVPPQPNGKPRGNGTALNIILAVIGGLVILTVLISSARGAFAALSRDNATQSASVQGGHRPANHRQRGKLRSALCQDPGSHLGGGEHQFPGLGAEARRRQAGCRLPGFLGRLVLLRPRL
ncbi:hypothetical protein AAHB37_16700 [Glutamicibacter halophytocola]|uniref:hypothetical protein n=1 Tax=Glutamicibacter halophytocola TaxID=1933880 RepID=UPI0032199C2C